MNDEKKVVKELGDYIGYGRVMQLAQECWREHLIPFDLMGGEMALGPCVAATVSCPHPLLDANGHCDICCGAGWITKGVAELLPSRTG
jgi:hypothetical protein